MGKKTISITEGRKKLFKIAEEIQNPDNYYVFTVDGVPQVVLMSQKEFESIMETIEILSDPEIVKDLEQSEQDFKQGKYSTWDEVKKELGIRQPELILRETPKKKYGRKKRK